MALEDLTGGSKYINSLVITNPVGNTDPKAEGDDHLRGIKNTLKNTFPNITGAVTATQAELNRLVGATAAGQALMNDADAAAQRTTLELGTIATQAASAVAITGGTISGITDLAVADGGTGASDAATAFANIKQTATTSATGAVELATSAEAIARTDATRAMTPDTTSSVLPIYTDTANGAPSFNTVFFSVSSDIAESTWESCGPSGSGATNILTGLPAAGYDWVDVTIRVYMHSAGDTASTDRLGQVFARKGGTSLSGIYTQVAEVYYTTSSTGLGDGGCWVRTKIPLSAAGIFDMSWTTNNNSTTSVLLLLNGYGYNGG